MLAQLFLKHCTLRDDTPFSWHTANSEAGKVQLQRQAAPQIALQVFEGTSICVTCWSAAVLAHPRQVLQYQLLATLSAGC